LSKSTRKTKQTKKTKYTKKTRSPDNPKRRVSVFNNVPRDFPLNDQITKQTRETLYQN